MDVNCVNNIKDIIFNYICNNSDLVINIFNLFIDGLLAYAAFKTISQTRQIQKESIKPAISFFFFSKEGEYRLECENTGKSGVKNLKIKLLSQKGTLNELSFKNTIYEKSLTLYPNEKISAIIGMMTINENNDVILNIEISYEDCVTHEKISFLKKDIVLSDYSQNNKEILILNNIATKLNEISYSNNRMANYFEGRTFFKWDEQTAFPNGSFYEDLRDAVHNQKSYRPKSMEDWEKIKKEKLYKDKRDKARVLMITEEDKND